MRHLNILKNIIGVYLHKSFTLDALVDKSSVGWQLLRILEPELVSGQILAQFLFQGQTKVVQGFADVYLKGKKQKILCSFVQRGKLLRKSLNGPYRFE